MLYCMTEENRANNHMQKSNLLALLAVLCLCIPTRVSANWQVTKTGINDDFKSIAFVGSKGLVIGGNGLYYTDNGGKQPGDWKKLHFANNSALENLKNRTRFTDCTTNSYSTPNAIMLCGKDTVRNKAVIIQLNTTNWSAKQLYEGEENSALNAITYEGLLRKFVAAGNDGLIVSFDTTSLSIIESPYDYDYIDVLTYRPKNAHYMVLVSAEHLVLDRYQSSKHNFSSYRGKDDHMAEAMQGEQSTLWIAGNGYTHYYSNILSLMPNYDLDTLQGQCMYYFDGYMFVGTPGGIYRSGYRRSNYLEKMPSALDHSVHDLTQVGDTLYACAANGAILRTHEVEEPTVLHIDIRTPAGGCNNATARLTANYGSTASCAWYIDGVPVGGGCGNISRDFEEPGTYELMLIAENSGGYKDTSIQSFLSVTVPDETIPFTFSDTVICQQAQVIIKLDRTEKDIIYSLSPSENAGNHELLGSERADSFYSPVISTSGEYTLQARHRVARCTTKLEQKQQVKVEKTKARIHPQSINVYEGDTARFFDKSTDAQFNKWVYEPTPSWFKPTGQETEAVYDSTARVNVKLIAWSEDGCKDSTSLRLTTYYNDSIVPQDSVWSVFITGYDTQYVRYSHNHMVPSMFGGTLIDGSHTNKPTFQSTNGNSYLSSQDADGYIARYDSAGVLKWVVQRTKTPSIYSTGGAAHVSTLTEDNQGNILASGLTAITDSRGDVYEFSNSNLYTKLNADGEMLYHLAFRLVNLWTRWTVHTDEDNNIYCLGGFSSNYVNTSFVLERNGDSIGVFRPILGNDDNYMLLKFDTEGNFKWARYYAFPLHNNSISFTRLGFDKNNNVYVTGSSRYRFTTTDPVGYRKQIIPFGNNAIRMFFVQKLDSTGTSQWTTMGYTLGDKLEKNSPRGTTTYAQQSVTSKDGDTYIVGQNDAWSPLYRFVFDNADGTSTIVHKGKYFVMKVNSDGMLEWVEGTKKMYNYFGYVSDIILEDEKDLYVLAKCMNDRYANTPSVFTSSNGDSIGVNMLPYQLAQQDYFIAQYDTAGVLYKIMLNGVNEDVNEAPASVEAHHLAKHNSGFYVTSYCEYGDLRLKNEWVNWGQVLKIDEKSRPSILTSFHPDKAITYLPNEKCVHKRHDVKQAVVSCGPYIGSDGTVYSASGHQRYADTAYLGCDTVITIRGLEVTIDSMPIRRISDTACRVYVSETGLVYDSSGVYIERFHRAGRCDSLVEYDVTIYPEYKTFTSATGCEEYTFPSGKVASSSGWFWDTIQTAMGCDSLIHFELEVIKINPGIVERDSHLFALDTIGAYTWYNCDLETQVYGETDSFLKPIPNVNYAVIVSRKGCSDTSACLSIEYDPSQVEVLEALDVRILPNPTRNNVSVVFNSPLPNATLEVYSSAGQRIQHRLISEREIEVKLSEAPGVYYLVLTSGGLKYTAKVVKI